MLWILPASLFMACWIAAGALLIFKVQNALGRADESLDDFLIRVAQEPRRAKKIRVLVIITLPTLLVFAVVNGG